MLNYCAGIDNVTLVENMNVSLDITALDGEIW